MGLRDGPSPILGSQRQHRGYGSGAKRGDDEVVVEKDRGELMHRDERGSNELAEPERYSMNWTWQRRYDLELMDWK